MRRSLALVLVLPLLASAAANAQTLAPSPPPADAAQAKRAGLQVSIDRAKVDLAGHKLEVKLSRPCEKVRLKVLGQSGAVLAEVEKAFNGAAAGTVLEVSWTPSSEEAVGRIEVWGHDTDGFFSGVAITPWNMTVPHEELKGETDSDVIRAGEVPKLEASLSKISDAVSKHTDLGPITLYVVGHTDTVGSPEHNLGLSRKRARSIAAWFKSRGLKIAIAYEGLGQSAPLVKTGDQVDEPRNRRADYILSLDPPKLPASGSWKGI
jgi:outer membrane protein OmpA-like peptidoglycan-associated protein